MENTVAMRTDNQVMDILFKKGRWAHFNVKLQFCLICRYAAEVFLMPHPDFVTSAHFDGTDSLLFTYRRKFMAACENITDQVTVDKMKNHVHLIGRYLFKEFFNISMSVFDKTFIVIVRMSN